MRSLIPILLPFLFAGCSLVPLTCGVSSNFVEQTDKVRLREYPSTIDEIDNEKDEGWILNDYQAALAESKRTGKPIFVDFTGYTCTNCRWMERNVFTRSDVRDLMNQYVLARLYTDRRDSLNQMNRQMQIDRFKTIDLPLYALFSIDDKLMGQTVFTRDVEAFKSFLKRGLQGTTVAAASTSSEKSEGEIAIR